MTLPQPEQRETEIKERLAKATPGPWVAYRGDAVRSEYSPDGKVYGAEGVYPDRRHHIANCFSDAAFIANSRSDLEWALSLVESLREELAAKERAAKRAGYWEGVMDGRGRFATRWSDEAIKARAFRIWPEPKSALSSSPLPREETDNG